MSLDSSGQYKLVIATNNLEAGSYNAVVKIVKGAWEFFYNIDLSIKILDGPSIISNEQLKKV